MDYVRLSKTLSYILRHAPGEFGLSLDEEGFVPVEDLLKALEEHTVYRGLTGEDLEDLLKAEKKRRYEITAGKIRALYGHSIKRITKPPAEPPDALYHGTSPGTAERILKYGLRPMGRKYVHLSTDVETALEVGGRRSKNPVVLVIDAGRAWRDGVQFYRGNENTWLSDPIGPEYISVKE
jgi:putative RNA 2'-phosphotransferase